MTVTETIYTLPEDTVTAPEPRGVADPWGPEIDDEAHIVRGLD